MRLFHFSDDPAIGRFVPRPVRVAADRPKGKEWLNDPLVWAIAEERQYMYLFPRDCPRILLWASPETTAADVERWLEGKRSRTLAYVERAWLERLQVATIVRYELPAATFHDTHDAGMWVSRDAVSPIGQVTLTDLPVRLAESGAELTVVNSLLPWKSVWSSSVHASGIRLRNAQGWSGSG